MRRLLTLILVLAAAVGCRSTSPEGDVMSRFSEPTGLDYMLFLYQPAPENDPISRLPIRMEVHGSGYLEMLTGRSSRVTDDFWKNTEDVHWQDLRSDRVIIPKDRATAYFRRFIAAGVFEEAPDEDADAKAPSLIVSMRLGRKKRARVTSREDFLELFRQLLAEF